MSAIVLASFLALRRLLVSTSRLSIVFAELAAVNIHRRTPPKFLVKVHCGKAELWLSPCFRCSNSIFWQNYGVIPVKFWKSMLTQTGSPQKHVAQPPHKVHWKHIFRGRLCQSYTSKGICMYVCMYVCVYIYIYIYIYIHMTTGHRVWRKELLCFSTMPCRHTPLLVYFFLTLRAWRGPSAGPKLQ